MLVHSRLLFIHGFIRIHPGKKPIAKSIVVFDKRFPNLTFLSMPVLGAAQALLKGAAEMGCRAKTASPRNMPLP
jgi:hypothetical protein